MGNKVLNRVSGLSVLTVTLAIVLLQQASANTQPAPAIFENVTIGTNFSPDPLTVRGISGGSVAASQVAGRSKTDNGPCVGFVDEKPDHTLVLKNRFAYLKLLVQSPEDTTLIVQGPGGTWCNDEFDGKNPGIAGEWLQGKYNLWVGSYEKNKYNPYTVRITETR